MSFPRKIVSGGQTGVDRAALDVASALGFAAGGWCPRGRRAEDGPIPASYPLRAAPVADTAVRTRLNVRDSDATLILVAGPMDPGTRLTRNIARTLERPHRVVDLRFPAPPAELAAWLRRHRVAVLNVAGPRESRCPGIGAGAGRYLASVLRVAAPARRLQSRISS